MIILKSELIQQFQALSVKKKRFYFTKTVALVLTTYLCCCEYDKNFLEILHIYEWRCKTKPNNTSFFFQNGINIVDGFKLATK